MNYKKIFKNKKMRFKILSMLRFIPDKTMLKLQYRIKSGRKLNLSSPQRYTEKIQWYKLYYRNPIMQQCASKYMVRDYVKSKGLEHILNDLHAVFKSPEDICFENLPNKFVLKLSNGSSTNIIIKDKDQCNLSEIKQKFVDFIAQSKSSAGREWVYKEDSPVIIAEKYIEDTENKNGEINDYKIFCFEGRPEYIICVSGRNTDNYNHVVYDMDWNRKNVEIGDSSSDANYPKPDTFEQMKEIARILSEDFPAARVDLYSVKGKIYFGEITFFPWSGYMDFHPDSFDFELGEKFALPEKNINC